MPRRLRPFLFVLALGLPGGPARGQPAVHPSSPVAVAEQQLQQAATSQMRRVDGRWGVLVASLTRGDTLLSLGADLPVRPASVAKLYTTALALERLGPDWRFRTPLVMTGTLDVRGVLHGDLVLRGDGDPTLSGRLGVPVAGAGVSTEGGGTTGTGQAALALLADRLGQRGVRRVTGALWADDRAFESRHIPLGWLERYRRAAYAAPVSALSLNENLISVVVEPDGRAGLVPAALGHTLRTRVRSVRGRGAALRAVAEDDGGQTVVTVSGTIGAQGPARRLAVVVPSPARYTGGVLGALLVERGVQLQGGLRLGAPRMPSAAETPPVAVLVSPPLAEIVGVMNRTSNNHMAEHLFRRASRGAAAETVGSAEAGSRLLGTFLAQQAGVRPGTVVFADGSGLSVDSRVSARATVQLLGLARAKPWGAVFLASLPVAGVTVPGEAATLRHRLRGTLAQGNLAAKTGTTNDVTSLSGYVRAQNGELLAFAFFYNGPRRAAARPVIDAMAIRLAGFTRP